MCLRDKAQAAASGFPLEEIGGGRQRESDPGAARGSWLSKPVGGFGHGGATLAAG